MKRTIIALLLCFAVMTVSAQVTDMSYYTEEFLRTDGTFIDRLNVLQNIQEAGHTGIGDFYHEAIKYLILKWPDIATSEDRVAANESGRIICQGLAAEGQSAAAGELWQVVLISDVIREINDGFLMQDALIALGQVGGRDFIPHIVLRLDDFNTLVISDVESRRRVQRAVVGAINALETLADPAGYRPVFFVSVGWYDTSIKTIASLALPNIMDDPGEILAEVIRDPSSVPEVKYVAWNEMLRSNAPGQSKAKVAAVALDTGWFYSTPDPGFQRILREMRMSAIDTIRIYGVEDESVYLNLEKSYRNNFVNVVPHYDEILRTLNALGVIGSDEAVQLLLNFLRELHDRRRIGPWGNRERQVLQWVLPAIGLTKTQSMEVRQLLTTIQRSDIYTGAEQTWARDALRALDS
jgi:hypothetical protein